MYSLGATLAVTLALLAAAGQARASAVDGTSSLRGTAGPCRWVLPHPRHGLPGPGGRPPLGTDWRLQRIQVTGHPAAGRSHPCLRPLLPLRFHSRKTLKTWPRTTHATNFTPLQEPLLTMAIPEDRPEVAALVQEISIPVVLVAKVGRAGTGDLHCSGACGQGGAMAVTQ